MTTMPTVQSSLLTVTAGAGGTEAQEWSRMLVRMYTRWARARGYEVEDISLVPGQVAGLRSATLLIRGREVHNLLRGEDGVHRLSRISPFGRGRARQTSFCAVEVLPYSAPVDLSSSLDLREVRLEPVRGDGPGGQHRNKTESGIRATHLPTGISARADCRSQSRSREMALATLQARLQRAASDGAARARQDRRRARGEASFGHQVRSYVLNPAGLVKDHRTGAVRSDAERVLAGDLEGLLA